MPTLVVPRELLTLFFLMLHSHRQTIEEKKKSEPYSPVLLAEYKHLAAVLHLLHQSSSERTAAHAIRAEEETQQPASQQELEAEALETAHALLCWEHNDAVVNKTTRPRRLLVRVSLTKTGQFLSGF